MVGNKGRPPIRKRSTLAPGGPGLDAKIVRINEITDQETALCEEVEGGNEIVVPLMPQRAKGGLPQVGERWIIDRSLGRWQFSYVLRSNAAYNGPFEVVEALPTAEAGRRGQVVLVVGGDGDADTLQICLKSDSDTYSWRLLQTG